MSRYKRWMVAGCTTGLATVLIFVGLATHVFLADPVHTPRFTVLAILDVLLGTTSGSLIIGGNMCRWLAELADEYGKQRWWKGYSAAVEDLKVHDDNVVDLPVPTNRNGRHG